MHPYSLAYFPIAVGLGALHALEPGHAKTMMAAYLIGIKGRWRDAVTLGLSAAATHSLIVISIALTGLFLGEKEFAGNATRILEIASSGIVILMGVGLFILRLRRQNKLKAKRQEQALHHQAHEQGYSHEHPDHDHHEHGHSHDHDDLSEDTHAATHAAQMPDYVQAGQNPGLWQVIAFGAAGGLMPCPASITVMLLALSVGSAASGVVLVMGFSLGLALTLVGIGLLVVGGMKHMARSGRTAWLSQNAGVFSAAMVTLSGIFALLVVLNQAK
jgi:nickel/cobalt transporter (NicO) family protein